MPDEKTVDKEKVRASMARLYDIFKDVSDTVTQVSTWRCPYKNVRDGCTANFGCRNQFLAGPPGDLPICTGSDNLDYRNAWEV